MRTHVGTFHKCASNWFRRLFRDAADQNGANILVDKPNEYDINKPADRGSPNSLMLYRNPHLRDILANKADGERIVLCVRDPKDTVVSQYWSWKNSHANNSAAILKARQALQEMSVRDGMLHLVSNRNISFLNAAETWAGALDSTDIRLLRYEDVLKDFDDALSDAFEFANLPVDQKGRQEMKDAHSFAAMAKRKPGDEDSESHYRKGVAGDWASYFDQDLTDAFNLHYGAICKILGYDLPVVNS